MLMNAEKGNFLGNSAFPCAANRIKLFGQREFLIWIRTTTPVLPDGASSARVLETETTPFDTDLHAISVRGDDLKELTAGQ